MIDTLQDKKYLPVMFAKEFYPTFKDREEFRKCVDYYLAIMIRMINDALEERRSQDSEYDHYLQRIRDNDPGRLLEIFTRASDRILMNAERKLLFDAISYEIISYI